MSEPATSPQASQPSPDGAPLMEVRDLVKHFPIRKGLLQRQVGAVRAVDGVSFDVCAARRSASSASRAAASRRPRGCSCG